MAWIESHQSLLHHKKTNRAIALLKVNRYKFIGHMHALWWWALDNVPSGHLDDLMPAEIADACGWDVAKAEEFVNTLVAVGFIDEVSDEGLYLHNWDIYAGKFLKGKDAKREAGRRGGLKSGEVRRSKTPKQNEAESILLQAKRSTDEAPTNLPNQPTNQTRPTDPLDAVAASFARFGFVTAGTADAIGYSVKDYTLEWVEKAVRVASGASFTDRPGWNYIESILERWKAQGGPDEPRQLQAVGRVNGRRQNSGDDIAAAWEDYERKQRES